MPYSFVKIAANIAKTELNTLLHKQIIVSVSLPMGLNGCKNSIAPEERLFEAVLTMLQQADVKQCIFLIGATGSQNLLTQANAGYFKKTLVLYDEKKDGEDLVQYFNKLISPLAKIQEDFFSHTCHQHIMKQTAAAAPDQRLTIAYQIIRWEDACNHFSNFEQQLLHFRQKYIFDALFRKEVNHASNEFLDRHKETKQIQINEFADLVKSVRPDIAQAINNFNVFFKLLGVDYVLRENAILACFGEQKIKTLLLYPKEDFSKKFPSTFKEHGANLEAKKLQFKKKNGNNENFALHHRVYASPYLETPDKKAKKINYLLKTLIKRWRQRLVYFKTKVII